MLHPEIGAVRVLGVGVHHRGVGPAGGALLGDGRGDRRVLGLEQVHLERPGAGGDDALVLEVVDLDHRVVPVAADELALLAQEVERGRVLVLVELVGVGDAELGLVRHQVLGGVGDVDRAVVGLDAALVRLAVGQGLLLEDHRPGGGRLLEDLGVVHQHVRAPLVGHAVVHAVDGEPGGVLEPLVDLLQDGMRSVLIGCTRLPATSRSEASPEAVTRSKPPSFISATISSEVLAVLTLTLQPVASSNLVTQSKALSVSPRSM